MIRVNQPRRSPRGPDRKRDPERTRERLLEAAVVEFGEHGYAGARISAIARRAGVNQQLISYYFDGKEGLFRALQERWRTVSTQASAPERPLAEVVAEFLKLNVEYRPWARMLVWGALADSGAGPDDDPFFAGMVDDLRRRQEAGELAADLDPGHLMLLLFGAVLVGVGWLVGVLLLWASPRWSLADKLLGALILPWGLFMPVDLALQNPQFWNGPGSSAALVVAMAAPIFTALWLTYRARKATAIHGTYRWGTGVLALGVALLAIPLTMMLVLAAA